MTTTGKSQDVRYRFLLSTFICYVPLTVGLCLWAWRAGTLPRAVWPALIALGVVGWTFIEYLLHRFLLHYRPRTSALREVVEALHLGHHREPHDEAKITVPVYASLPIASALVGLYWLMAGCWEAAALLMVGTIAGYLYYEAMHFFIHRGSPRRGWLARLRRQHFFHHFKDQERCFGVTTALWDGIFGTGRTSARLRRVLFAHALYSLRDSLFKTISGRKA
jgi:4-hydroxysphinganine ceramide fatty acyl 2-hydroxylase